MADMQASDMSDEVSDKPKRKLKPRDPAKLCGAGTPPCKQWKGFKTPHPGVGRCSVHGGMTQSHIMAAEAEKTKQKMRVYGIPIDTDPLNALMGEVKRSAGIVARIEQRIAHVEGDELDEQTLIKIFNDERAHLARVCKMALDHGVSQGLLDILQQQAQAWIAVIEAIFADPRLGLSEPQKEVVPSVIDVHLEKLLKSEKEDDGHG